MVIELVIKDMITTTTVSPESMVIATITTVYLAVVYLGLTFRHIVFYSYYHF